MVSRTGFFRLESDTSRTAASGTLRGVWTLWMYLIIIVSIAPRIPGNLTHYHWPRLLRNKPVQGLFKSHLKGR